MNAKQFFYVCAGLFLLVAAYSIGAHRADAQARAVAQGEPTLVAALGDASHVFGMVLDSSGRFFWRVNGVWSQSPTRCPPGTPVDLRRGSVEFDPDNCPACGSAAYLLAMANGDVYAWPEDTNPAQPWQFTYLGNPLSGVVQLQGKTWSGVKEGYRK